MLPWIFFILIVSCKKEEPFNATITFVYPYENAEFDFLDTLNIQARITANKPIDRIQIQLKAADNSPACSAIFISDVGSNEVQISEFYPLDNNYLPTSSNYRLEILISSGDETVKSYRLITVNEIPKVIKSLWSVVKSQNGTEFYRVDSSGSTSVISSGNDFLNAAVNSRFRTIAYNGTTTTGFFLLNANTLNQISNLPCTQLPQQTFFGSYYDASTNLYFISMHDGSVKGISMETGNILFLSSENPFYIPHSIFKTDGYLFTVSTDRITGIDKLQILFYPSGSPRQAIDLSFKIIGILEKDVNEVWVFANENGRGRIYSYSISANGFAPIYDFGTNSINDVIVNNDGEDIIATQNGIYRFTGTGIPIRIVNANFSEIIPDEVNDGYFGISGLSVKVLDRNFTVLNTLNFPDSVRNFNVLYSK